MSISDEAKCTAIGAKLASMRALQMLLASGAETLRLQCHDSTVNRIAKFPIRLHGEDG